MKSVSCALGLALALLSCSPRADLVPPRPAARPALEGSPVELVVSVPEGAGLSRQGLADAADLWLAMIDGARESLEIAEFYMVDEPPSRLTPIILAILRAADRGVAVRVLVDSSFHSRYPELPDRLARHPGIDLRRFDARQTMGGILHAKYFVVDGRDAYLGSQNFDWRSLSHIHELGVRLRRRSAVDALVRVFRDDFRASGGEAPRAPPPSQLEQDLLLAASPEGHLPEGVPWDLPRIVAMIDGARSRIRVQLLAYKASSRDGSPFSTLDEALRRAAGRGIPIELQVAPWSAGDATLRALAAVPRITVRVLTVPPSPRGEIPFARVIHAKYMVVDGARSWLGTSNWEGDYFLKSRNVGVFVEDRAFAERLDRIFEDISRVLPASRVPEPQ